MKLENILEYEVYKGYVEITGCNGYAEGEMIIPETIEGLPVTSIGVSAFGYQSFLKSVTIPKSVTNIGNGAFQECSSLKSITIPDSITNIGTGAFSYCFALEKIHVAPGNHYYMDIDGVLFSKDQKILVTYPAGKLDQSYFIPDSVTRIGEMAFYYCDSLLSVTIPNNVTIIGWEAFSSCSSLKSITIPDSVTDIEESAFCCCDSLTSITIPNNVTTIRWLAFSSCSSLESIIIQNAKCEIGNYYDQGVTLSDTAVIYGYPDSTAQAYAKKYNREFVALKD
ncbi:MAG: leucine-rich repeat domain-containing protein [Oscillospiraceae bacterium]|nr:leucine-rich repeat domain-containing protein [Oscillospiraceae bacterium]